MSLIFATQLTAVATTVLAVFAVVTAVFAILAFRKQAKEVSDQAKLLKVQSGQLEEQRKLTNVQTPVLELQATELRESLDERKREAEERRSAQAARVFIAQKDRTRFRPPDLSELLADDAPIDTTAPEPECFCATVTVVNASNRPIYDAELRWHRGSASHGDPNPQSLGTIMPGGETDRTREFPLDTNMAVSGAVLRFRDAAGIIWMRRPDGGLKEQP